MAEQQEVRGVPRLIEDDFIVPMSPKLAKLLGFQSAMILQQVHYHIIQGHDIGITSFDNRKWYRKTYKHWSKELCMTEATLVRHILKLESQYLLYACEFNLHHKQQKWYALNEQGLRLIDKSMDQLLDIPKRDISKAIIELVKPTYDNGLIEQASRRIRLLRDT